MGSAARVRPQALGSRPRGQAGTPTVLSPGARLRRQATQAGPAPGSHAVPEGAGTEAAGTLRGSAPPSGLWMSRDRRGNPERARVPGPRPPAGTTLPPATRRPLTHLAWAAPAPVFPGSRADSELTRLLPCFYQNKPLPFGNICAPPRPPVAGAQRIQGGAQEVPTAARPLPAAHCPCDRPGCGSPLTWGGGAAHRASDTGAGDGAGPGVTCLPVLFKTKRVLTVSAA